MFCKLFFFYSLKNGSKSLIKEIEKNNEPYRIVTNSPELFVSLKKEHKNVFKINDIIPDVGKEAWEIFEKAKKIHVEYKNVFQDLKFKNVVIFNGFEYPILRQLNLLQKAKKILENKQNTIFVFTRFYPIYFSIMKTSIDLSYENEMSIGFLKENKIEFISPIDKSNTASYKNRFSRQRTVNFLKFSLGKKMSLNKLIELKKFASGVISFYIRLFAYKWFSILNIDPVESILKKIDKKIEKTDSKYNAKCAIFISGSREDLFLKPWYPVLEKFKTEKIPYQVLTSDLVSSLSLSKSRISIVSLFEEVNILAEEIKKSTEGKRIHKTFNEIVAKNNSLIGIENLSSHILNQIYRSVSIVIICEHIIKKMKLKSMVAAVDGEMLENLAISICKKYQIPSYAIIWGQLEEIPILSHWFHADKIFVEGTKLVEGLMNLAYNKKKMIITGNPVNDNLKNMKTNESKKILEKKHGIKKDKKLVVVAMSRIHYNDGLWMSDLVKFCNKNDFEIVIKIHPAYKLEQDSRSTNMIDLIKNKCENLKFFITYDEIELYTLLSGSDLVITEYSDVGLDTIILKKPLITVNFLNEDYSQFVEFHKYDASIYVNHYLKLEKTILDIFERNKYLEELKNGRKKFAEGYGLDNSSSATEKIFKELLN